MSKLECMQARDLMLEAEVDELKGNGESSLAQHIKSCAECAQYAQRIVRGYGDLEQGLNSLTPAVAVRKLRPRMFWIPAPVAVAAILTLLLLRGPDTMLDVTPDVTGVTARMFQQQPLVTPPEGRQAIIIEKNDLTVVWLY